MTMKTCSHCGYRSEAEFRFCPTCGTKTVDTDTPADSLIGRTLGTKYRILSEIGSGAMGTVYLSEHIGLKKKIAIKVLHSDLPLGEESLQRFQREGIAAGKFTHPNAIQIFDFDKADGNVFFLAMEYVEGANLKAFLRQRGRLSLDEALSIARQVLGALAEAHRHGIVHRDLKPDNIMVTPGPTGDLAVKVLDFGLSKLVDRARSGKGSLTTQVGRILGTPLYMAPEQCAGDEADLRADLYAVGLILYEMVSGLTPFPDESTTEILFTRTTREAPSITESHPDLGIPVDLDEILKKALQRRREDRFQSAAEMLAAIDAIRYDVRGPVRARRPLPELGGAPHAAASAARPAPSRTRGLLGVLAVVLVLGIGGGAWFFVGRVSGGTSSAKRVSEVPRERRSELENRYVDRLDEARRSLRTGQTDLALSAVGDAVAMDCRDSEAYLVRADAHRQRGDPDAARLDFLEALELDPDFASAHAGLGWLSLDAGDAEDALGRFQTASEKDPGSAEALAGQGAAMHVLGREDEALDLLTRAIGIDADYAPAYRYLGLVHLAKNELDPAAQSLLQAKRRETDWRTSAALGDVRALQGQDADAEREYQDALRRNPDAGSARLSLASMLIDQERWTDARTELATGLRREPGNGALHVLLGICLMNEDDRAGAIEELEHGLEKVDDPRAAALLGMLYQGEGRHEDALEQYDRALTHEDAPLQARLDRGLALFELERYEDARAAFEDVLTRDPDDVEAHYALGILHMDYLGDPEQAAAHLKRYLELGGEDRRARDWLRRLGQ